MKPARRQQEKIVRLLETEVNQVNIIRLPSPSLASEILISNVWSIAVGLELRRISGTDNDPNTSLSNYQPNQS